MHVRDELRPELSMNPRCPHVLFREIFGAATVAELLEYVIARQDHFEPAIVRNRESGRARVDLDRRDCLNHAGLGPFQTPYRAFMRSIMGVVLEQLHLSESAVEPGEFEFSAYRDRGRFAPHIDVSGRIRIVSCVYYFAVTPRRFAGGELRLHALPGLTSDAPPFVDIEPEPDTLVAFPSWMPHEVRPVRVPSGAWADSRFTVNCWIQRPTATPRTDLTPG